ncbi:MAG: metal ABC transporter ATP-binding protein [Candidatus Thermoplasmatota archaeon]|nr:metal ABC transporter ATP-binding protein [Euryarchaeota archaeon]MBU4032292.1 metal ABC transporter ATP-binding protein [Candidatus Thermoplasmatota archaeon]MBU4071453.1 metal ABC transporter ATP-binding protein [Candidatus Thermoplasmatota archaeon]MBU4144443.1 metal ABC transporter ATP-binding protein [Candidatus Thermoplasmatota archaeon]MBU4592325.1 metal ABC transporter ATP-binding protein [Candidatus Thermoplasmatota archaeon]
MERKPVLEVRNLDISRGNESVVRDANFTIYSGEYVGIIGPNGGGKTTLLLGILGSLKPDRGSIQILGQEQDKFRQWEKVAYVSQNAVNFDSSFPMTVREMVSLGRVGSLNLGRKLSPADWKAVDEHIQLLGLEELAEKRIGQLSGGQKQRVFVAKAMVRNPEILFLDEPIAGVDPETQEAFYKKLSDLNVAKGVTIIIVSHDLAAVFCRMSKVLCVSRDVHVSEIGEDFEPTEILRKAYGEHFHFVYHKHECKGDFHD